VTLNPIAWCAWGLAALGAAFIDRNPYIQLLLLMVFLNVWFPYRRGESRFWKVGAILAIAPVLFSVALSRFGRTVLFRLPDLPVIGGQWSLEAVVFGASTGIALLLVVTVFGVLQSTVRSMDVVSLLPAPLYRAGSVFALAVAFAPQTIASLRAINEARLVRGQPSGWRGAPSLLVPLLLTSMERALQYGESLDARGFGSRRRSRYRLPEWRAADYLVLTFSAASLVMLLLQPVVGYNPYAGLIPSVPSPAALGAVLALVMPAIVAATSRRSGAADLA
jgi:energy-coupling factor transport system permease protein